MSEVHKADIIEKLNLQKHPEGGYFRETYRAREEVNAGKEKKRVAATGIYFLITEGVCTNWHRLSSDELWHFYKGNKLVLEIIDTEGKFRQLSLDDELSGEGKFQQLIPKKSWQRAYSTGAYTLVGCTVAPGFEFQDFEMIQNDDLVAKFPEIRSEINRNPFE